MSILQQLVIVFGRFVGWTERPLQLIKRSKGSGETTKMTTGVSPIARRSISPRSGPGGHPDLSIPILRDTRS